MNFGQAISSVFSNYANFNGRSRRSEFWYFILFAELVNLGISILLCVPFLGTILWVGWNIAILIPSIAVAVRRLHDTGRSGLYFLFILIPLVGIILLIIFCAEDSQPGDNIYGRNPKYFIPGPGPAPGPTPNVGYLALQCLSGPLQGQTYNIPQSGMLIGTAVNCTVRFPANTPGVSQNHCEIRWMQGVPVLIDLDSTYGTTMGDGRRLAPRSPERIAAGTRFYVGGAGILLQVVTV